MVIRPSSVRARPRVHERGFTLTELMVVVTLTGILATIGIASFRGELDASKTSEAAAVIQALRGGEEAYRAENQHYLDVSGTAGRWYPTSEFNAKVYNWDRPDHADYARWRRLGAPVSQGVKFRYLVRAGTAGGTWPELPFDVNLPTPVEPWYVIRARADADGDGVYCDAVATSLNNELIIVHPGE